MKTKKERPLGLPGPGGARKTWGTNTPHVNTAIRFVNQILFHVIPLAGLLLSGGWLSRLVIWLPLLDLTAKLLRSLMEARI